MKTRHYMPYLRRANFLLDLSIWVATSFEALNGVGQRRNAHGAKEQVFDQKRPFYLKFSEICLSGPRYGSP